VPIEICLRFVIFFIKALGYGLMPLFRELHKIAVTRSTFQSKMHQTPLPEEEMGIKEGSEGGRERKKGRKGGKREGKLHIHESFQELAPMAPRSQFRSTQPFEKIHCVNTFVVENSITDK